MIDLRTTTTYSFNWSASEANERFELRFSTTVGINDIENENNIEIYSHKNNVYISNMQSNTITKVEIYNITGTKIIDKKLNNSGVSKISVNEVSGNYIVKVISDNKVSVKKVFITK